MSITKSTEMPPPPNQLKLSEALARCHQEKWQYNKVGFETYRRAKHLVDFIGDKYIDEITNEDISMMMNQLYKDGKSKATINRYLASLRTISNLAFKKWRIIDRPYYFSLFKETNQRTRIVTKDEEVELLSIFNVINPEMADLILVLLDTGMRLQELLDLKYDEIKFEAEIPAIFIRKNKTDKPRSIPMTLLVQAILQRRRIENKKMPFTIKPNYAQKQWRIAKEKMGLKKDKEFVIHALRHTFASRLVEKGASLYEIKDILGHSTLKMVERYAHLQVKQLKKAIDLLEEYNATNEKPRQNNA